MLRGCIEGKGTRNVGALRRKDRQDLAMSRAILSSERKRTVQNDPQSLTCTWVDRGGQKHKYATRRPFSGEKFQHTVEPKYPRLDALESQRKSAALRCHPAPKAASSGRREAFSQGFSHGESERLQRGTHPRAVWLMSQGLLPSGH